MMKLRKVAAASALGLSMGLALLGSGVASAHGGPYANANVYVKNSHNVKVSVVQQVRGSDDDYGCGCGYGRGFRSFGFGSRFGWWGW